MTWRPPADASASASAGTGAAPGRPRAAASMLMRLGHPDRTRKWVFVVAAILLIIGGLMVGTAISSIQSERALVSQLREHSAVASAVVVDLFDQPDPGRRSGPGTTPNWAFHFNPPRGAIADTNDTSFDGTYSVAAPADRSG